MKWIFILGSAVFLRIAVGFCQPVASLSGEVRAAESGEILAFATVTITAEGDSSILYGGFSDESGFFTLQGLTPGAYSLHCSYLGYESEEIPVLIGTKNTVYDLGRISLQSQSLQLEEVVIEGEQGRVSPDLERKSFRLSDNIAQSGGSVLEAMKGLPGIQVDQEGNVLLRGSDKVLVLIDGKQSSLTGFGNQKGLDNIPVANIDRIEIINNPSARYDAAGMAGIINIVYKKEQRKGWNGDLGLSVGLGAVGKRKRDLPTELGSYQANPKLIPSFNLNRNTENLAFFFQSEVLFQKSLPNNEFTQRFYRDGRSISSQVPENRTQTHYILRSGLDWKLKERQMLRFSTVFDYESHIDTAQIPYIDLLSGQRNRYWHWKEDEVTGFFSLQLGYTYNFQESGHIFEANVQYTRGWENEQYFLNDSSAVRQAIDRTHIIAVEHTTSLLADYVKPLSYGRLEVGAKFQIRTLPVTYEIGQGDLSIIYPGLGEWSDWGENIYAGYANYIWEKKSYDIEAGVRIEHTEVYYDIDPDNIYYQENDAYNYFRVFPNIRFTLKPNAHNTLSLFFNNRVDRPGEPNLRVFPKYDDPELLKVGNPYVRPQFTQTYELAYKHLWNTGSFFLAGYYRDIEDPFIRVYSIDSSEDTYDIINKIYQNVGSGNNIGLEVIFSQSIQKFWDITLNFNGYQNEIDAYTGTLLFPFVREFSIPSSREFSWDIKWNNQLRINSQTSIQLTGIYLAPVNLPQGRRLARGSVDLGIRQKVWGEKGELSLSITDLFNTYGLQEEIEASEFSARYQNYYETQVFRLGFRYKF